MTSVDGDSMMLSAGAFPVPAYVMVNVPAVGTVATVKGVGVAVVPKAVVELSAAWMLALGLTAKGMRAVVLTPPDSVPDSVKLPGVRVNVELF